MYRILIFGGTTEGRLLAEFCASHHIATFVSVATEYGALLLVPSQHLRVITGRMNAAEMERFITANQIKWVFDATHPYAVEASTNIRTACERASVRCVRVLRAGSKRPGYGIFFASIDALTDYLNTTDGGILITTGSKELAKFRVIHNYRERCTIRVLPTENIIAECTALGFAKKRIIAEKGPFTEAQNMAHLRQSRGRFLVTKESGTAGGFNEKASAAAKCGAELLVISRPNESGISLDEAEKMLLEHNEGTENR